MADSIFSAGVESNPVEVNEPVKEIKPRTGKVISDIPKSEVLAPVAAFLRGTGKAVFGEGILETVAAATERAAAGFSIPFQGETPFSNKTIAEFKQQEMARAEQLEAEFPRLMGAGDVGTQTLQAPVLARQGAKLLLKIPEAIRRAPALSKELMIRGVDSVQRLKERGITQATLDLSREITNTVGGAVAKFQESLVVNFRNATSALAKEREAVGAAFNTVESRILENAAEHTANLKPVVKSLIRSLEDSGAIKLAPDGKTFSVLMDSKSIIENKSFARDGLNILNRLGVVSTSATGPPVINAEIVFSKVPLNVDLGDAVRIIRHIADEGADFGKTATRSRVRLRDAWFQGRQAIADSKVQEAKDFIRASEDYRKFRSVHDDAIKLLPKEGKFASFDASAKLLDESSGKLKPIVVEEILARIDKTIPKTGKSIRETQNMIRKLDDWKALPSNQGDAIKFIQSIDDESAKMLSLFDNELVRIAASPEGRFIPNLITQAQQLSTARKVFEPFGEALRVYQRFGLSILPAVVASPSKVIPKVLAQSFAKRQAAIKAREVVRLPKSGQFIKVLKKNGANFIQEAPSSVLPPMTDGQMTKAVTRAFNGALKNEYVAQLVTNGLPEHLQSQAYRFGLNHPKVRTKVWSYLQSASGRVMLFNIAGALDEAAVETASIASKVGGAVGSAVVSPLSRGVGQLQEEFFGRSPTPTPTPSPTQVPTPDEAQVTFPAPGEFAPQFDEEEPLPPEGP